MMSESQATHRRMAEEADDRALRAATPHASRSLRRIAAHHRLEAILAAYRENGR